MKKKKEKNGFDKDTVARLLVEYGKTLSILYEVDAGISHGSATDKKDERPVHNSVIKKS